MASNTSANASTFAWSFGDGASSSDPDPTHIYEQPGLYLVRLEACNPDTCETQTAIVNVTGNDAFDAGSLAADQAQPGTIDPAGDTDLWTFQAEAGGRATLTMTAGAGALVDPVLRLFGPSGALVSFNDDVAGSSTPTAEIVNFVLPVTGTYTVEASGFLNTTGVYMLTLTLFDPTAPWARFSLAPPVGVAPLAITMDNTSTNATSYRWDFGAGQTSSQAAPSHVFSAAGVYEVVLTACPGAACDEATTVVSVESNDGGPLLPEVPAENRIDFVDDIDSFTFSAEAGAEIQLDLVSDAIDAILFLRDPDGEILASDDDGGEGSNAQLQNLILPASGDYVVEAQAFPDGATGPYTIELRVDPEPRIRAAIDVEIPALTAPVTIRLTDASLGGPSSWRWTIDGELVSEERTLSREFSEAGEYRIALDACNARSCDSWVLQLPLGADPDGRALRSNESAFGTIDPPGDRDDWTLAGGAGAVLVATAIAETAGLDLTLELIDTTGTSIAFDDDGAGDLNPRLVATLPRAASYVLRIAGFGDTVAGRYRLDVQIDDGIDEAEGTALRAGWNLLAWPTSDSVAAVLTPLARSVERLFGWNADRQEFLGFDPALPSTLNTLIAPETGDGMWVRAASPAVWPALASSTGQEVELRSGFNLTSWSGVTGADPASAFKSVESKLLVVLAWDAARQQFLSYRPDAPAALNSLVSLIRGQGLWVEMETEGTWIADS